MAFQSRVLQALLDLFEAKEGPVLVDYAEDAPGSGPDGMDGLACPMRFDAPSAEDETLEEAVLREIRELQPWYDIALERRQRTTVGVTGLEIEEVARTLASWLTTSPPQQVVNGQSPAAMLKAGRRGFASLLFRSCGRPTPRRCNRQQTVGELVLGGDVSGKTVPGFA